MTHILKLYQLFSNFPYKLLSWFLRVRSLDLSARLHVALHKTYFTDKSGYYSWDKDGCNDESPVYYNFACILIIGIDPYIPDSIKEYIYLSSSSFFFQMIVSSFFMLWVLIGLSVQISFITFDYYKHTSF